MTVRIGIAGAAGRMGRALIAAIREREDCSLSALSLHRQEDAARLADLGASLPAPAPDAHALFAASDVVIDFTRPDAGIDHAAIAADTNTPLIVGTTGFTESEEHVLAVAGKRTALFRAANFSLGIALLGHLVRRAAHVLDEDFDIEIHEMHHRRKVDAPSGTALALGDAAARGRGQTDRSRFAAGDRSGQRLPGDIGFSVLRGGDVVGEHEVVFAGAGERLILGHRADDRMIFARGAVRAALWIIGREPGLYGMDDLLGLKE